MGILALAVLWDHLAPGWGARQLIVRVAKGVPPNIVIAGTENGTEKARDAIYEHGQCVHFNKTKSKTWRSGGSNPGPFAC